MLKHSEMFKEHGWSLQKLTGAPWGLLMAQSGPHKHQGQSKRPSRQCQEDSPNESRRQKNDTFQRCKQLQSQRSTPREDTSQKADKAGTSEQYYLHQHTETCPRMSKTKLIRYIGINLTAHVCSSLSLCGVDETLTRKYLKGRRFSSLNSRSLSIIEQSHQQVKLLSRNIQGSTLPRNAAYRLVLFDVFTPEPSAQGQCH